MPVAALPFRAHLCPVFDLCPSESQSSHLTKSCIRMLSSLQDTTLFPFCHSTCLSRCSSASVELVPSNRSNIFLQFQRFANFFYLIISIITFFPEIWPAGPSANIGPLGFVLLVTAVKEAVEDYNRHKADEKMNGTPVKVLDGETWMDLTWAEVTSQLCASAHVSSKSHFLCISGHSLFRRSSPVM